ncbi:unnamed protein product [Ilex paraguariensis]|uniref:EF-hand domain-containing protein n=1 Tax=Ilex paraguariensis TaxID=185542 RepID=A0ABC8UTE5_9AQUA
MKLINLFKSKKSRAVSRSDESYSSGFVTTSSESSVSSSSNHKSKPGNDLATPKSVLPSHSSVGDEWPQLSADMGCELVQAFKFIDRDGDGKIPTAELKALLSQVGKAPPNEEELKMMLSDVDRDGDGCISLEEFGAIGPAFGPPECDSELRETFDFFDADHNGKITAEELFNVFSVIGDGQCTLEDCRRMISGVDRNGDGFVCFEDFSRMMELQK